MSDDKGGLTVRGEIGLKWSLVSLVPPKLLRQALSTKLHPETRGAGVHEAQSCYLRHSHTI